MLNNSLNNVLTKQEITNLLKNDCKEVDYDHLISLIDNWSNGDKGEYLMYFAFDKNDNIITADNTCHEMFVEQFEKNDYDKAYRWYCGANIDDLKNQKVC